MRHTFSFLALITLLVQGLLRADDTPEIGDPLSDPPSRGFVSRAPASSWEEALISGNGKIGALVMGQPVNENIIFNHERLFMPWHPPHPQIDLSTHLDEIRSMIREGRYQAAADFAWDLAQRQGYDPEEMRWPDPFIPGFDLVIEMPSDGDVRDYRRSVDWATGVATVRWEDAQGALVRRLFVSRADDVAVLSITAQDERPVSCTLRLITHPAGDDPSAHFTEGIRDVAVQADESWITYRSSFSKTYDDSLQGYEGLAYVVPRNGKSEACDDGVRVTGAEEVLVFVWLDVLNDFAQSRLTDQKNRMAELGTDFDGLLARHTQIHGELFNRVRLDLGADADASLPSESLYDTTSLGALNPAVLEKEFDACRYAIISSTGDLPPALQGIWTGTWDSPWQGDFTIDGNVQSAIAAMLIGNFPEGMESYLSYTESFLPHYRHNAREIYGYRGILMPSRVSGHGYLHHFNDEYMWVYWISSAPWAAHYFYDYYLYTGDEKFLRERALPFMKEAALFYEYFLYEDEDGKYEFNPSYSPENSPGNSDSQICLNATMDIGLAKELLTNLISACTELGIEREGVARWRAMLDKMPDYLVNQDGAVKEWTTRRLQENYEHRHASHLCHLADWLPPDVAKDPALQQAFVKAIEMKMEQRWRGGPEGMAFGLVQLGMAATSLREADLAYEIVDLLAHRYWSATNMVTTHEPGELFNVDISGGLPAIIIQMLVDSMPGELTLLPALPDQWPSGRIEGVRCRGQIELNYLAWDGAEVVVELQSAIEQKIKVAAPGGIQSIAVEVKEDRATIDEQPTTAGGHYVTLPASRPVTLRIVRSLQ